MVAAKQIQRANMYTNTNKPVRDNLKLSSLRSAVLNLSVQQASFSSAPACSLDTFVIGKASTQREELAVVAQACFATSFSVISSVTRPYGAWPSSGRGVVRASRFRSAKIKAAKISSEGYGLISTKICTSENFLLYGKHTFQIHATMKHQLGVIMIAN